MSKYLISQVDISLSGLEHFASKTERLLRDIINFIMISCKGIQNAQLKPSRTQLFICVQGEAAHIRAHHGQPVDLAAVDIGNGESQVLPGGQVVPRPVRTVVPASERVASGQDER